MTGAILARIIKLEERRRPVLERLTKELRDAQVRAALSNPAQVIAIRERLLGSGNEAFARNGLPAIIAALRADT
ncbi:MULTISPECIES: hypothetical protein [unclassified Bosea (in: a-proteobacteria)]|uniref:hypothetical protein n=1 Tax=unclassified Bosea (in: a-proteobacteria) TaxID=2653178 RepID=UPI000F75EBEF|nr:MULTISPECIES: hypothetical protein [unclassified Bosea (in: a-proteobacteria)]AZO79627.1 hypothetical protein BLM15_19975 [Bosea sp. Tri-49]RXT16128.1 hypothetical protein B5U98_29420 [Bosea sp. Tri-39]RXT39820.1 hypothetical protein B5U99_06465 [Bosea sp. Tri-54]